MCNSSTYILYSQKYWQNHNIHPTFPNNILNVQYTAAHSMIYMYMYKYSRTLKDENVIADLVKCTSEDMEL